MLLMPVFREDRNNRKDARKDGMTMTNLCLPPLALTGVSTERGDAQPPRRLEGVQVYSHEEKGRRLDVRDLIYECDICLINTNKTSPKTKRKLERQSFPLAPSKLPKLLTLSY